MKTETEGQIIIIKKNLMKKKILVPIMAVAMMLTAGVNYKMIDSAVSETGFNIEVV